VAALLLAMARGARAADDRAQFLYRQDGRLYLYDVGTKSSSELNDIDGGDENSWKWSPDGRYLLVAQHKTGETHTLIRVYDFNSSKWLEMVNLTVATNMEVSWSADTRQFAYIQNIYKFSEKGFEGWWGELWRYDIAAGKSYLLYRTHSGLTLENLWWSPSGSTILFDEYQQMPDREIYHLKSIGVDGSYPIAVDAYAYEPHEVSWSPDGRWFIVMLGTLTFRKPLDIDYGEIHLFSENWEEERAFQLTELPNVRKENLRWSPDGKQILFEILDFNQDTSVWKRAHVELSEVLKNPDRNHVVIEPTNPTTDLSDIQFPAPDGVYTLYARPESGEKRGLYTAHIDGSDYQFTGVKLDRYDDFLGWRPGGANTNS
jgi:dipeptidyl aminopeptidase/acylaminoacyl peptidase